MAEAWRRDRSHPAAPATACATCAATESRSIRAKKLRIAVNNYRAGGSGGYEMFRGAKILWRSSQEIRDLIVAYYTEHRKLPDHPVAIGASCRLPPRNPDTEALLDAARVGIVSSPGWNDGFRLWPSPAAPTRDSLLHIQLETSLRQSSSPPGGTSPTLRKAQSVAVAATAPSSASARASICRVS